MRRFYEKGSKLGRYYSTWHACCQSRLLLRACTRTRSRTGCSAVVRLRLGPGVAVLCGFMQALACGGDESRLSPSAYDSPPERVIGTSLPSDESTGTNSEVP